MSIRVFSAGGFSGIEAMKGFAGGEALSDGACDTALLRFHPTYIQCQDSGGTCRHAFVPSCPIRFRPQWRRVVHVWRRGDICAEAGEMPADRLPCRRPKAISHLLCYADHLLIVFLIYIYIWFYDNFMWFNRFAVYEILWRCCFRCQVFWIPWGADGGRKFGTSAAAASWHRSGTEDSSAGTTAVQKVWKVDAVPTRWCPIVS